MRKNLFIIDFKDTFTHCLPTSNKILAEERQRLTRQKNILENRRRETLTLAWSVIGISFIAMITVLYLKWPVGDCVVFVAVVSLAVGVMNAVGIMAVGVVWAMAGVIVVVWVMDTAGVMAVVWVSVVAVGSSTIGDILFTKYLNDPINAADKALADLVELEASDKPDECIKLDKWRDKDKHIDTYLTALSQQDRKPVIGEYRVAKNWIATSEQRQNDAEKRERARQACERLASQN